MKKFFLGVGILLSFLAFNNSTIFAWVFLDVDRHFGERAINYITENCGAEGYVTSDGRRFMPDMSITRAELVELIVKCQNSISPQQAEFTPSESSRTYFPDVRSSDWYFDSVTYAREQGWVYGYGDGTFRPNAEVSRAEALAMITRSSFPAEEQPTDQVLIDGQPLFTDVQQDTWYEPIIYFGVDRGIITGYTDQTGAPTGYFMPESDVTRAEAAVMIERVPEAVESPGVPSGDYSGTPGPTPTTPSPTEPYPTPTEPPISEPPVITYPPITSGGFVESVLSTIIRPLVLGKDLSLPSRGSFSFPSPYNTQAMRITNSSDCGGNDCVLPVGYSYWRNTNNHKNSDKILIFAGLTRSKGGQGPTLFSYNKNTGEVKKEGALFESSNDLSYATGEGWYFSAELEDILYVNQGSKLFRFNVISKSMESIFDAANYMSNVKVWQLHSSYDDRVHSMTIRDKSTNIPKGCATFREDTDTFKFYPTMGGYDECQIDKSGKWLVIKENVDGKNGEDNRIINIDTGNERILKDEEGAGGHSDLGYGYMVANDNWDSHANAVKVWNFEDENLTGKLVYYYTDWSVFAPNHLSHSNAKNSSPSSQFACGSSANSKNLNRSNEIMCFKLDGSMEVVIVGPVMTDLAASGGGTEYFKQPKGNLDITGEYFIWTSNMGGERVDLFVTKIPTNLL